jgi:hypothetical protein
MPACFPGVQHLESQTLKAGPSCPVKSMQALRKKFSFLFSLTLINAPANQGFTWTFSNPLDFSSPWMITLANCISEQANSGKPVLVTLPCHQTTLS